MDNSSLVNTTDGPYDFLSTALVETSTVSQGVSLVDPTAVTKSCQQDLMELAAEIAKADSCVKANACNKLQVIAEQIRFLQRQAQGILLEAERNAKLHHVACNFVKRPGQIYHLYQRETGQFYFSMLSPEEWGSLAPPQTYKGSFRLEQDRSWTSVSQLQARNIELSLLEKFIPSDTSNVLQSVMSSANT
ncbi:PREDICTED: uncharacterized protein C1orf50 homolog [Wasmannia auropunctata]|uniref:uncharacterized protein C1orf50 homolog n=1 Tax=Wasmannia auropunctata TaxID=64793 RepID=UPI0005EE198F|nr:PREDICTED: uncharacterized protein C1orf50 homolog [Wasmannia auropunctata]XP_011685887.1 PREDICTED: uncharacterized protein C1orf50 homolog [Wasmannia auropunctata]